MKRTFNYTDRQKIDPSKITARLFKNPTGIASFDASVQLDGMNLPSDSAVYVEAYEKASYMRFDFGTVEAIQAPSDRQLVDLQSQDGVFFRVKVVDKSTKEVGRVLAIADGLAPRSLDTTSEALLHVRYVDLRHQIWRLDLMGDWPMLEVNERLEDIRITEIIRADNQFFSLVWPAVIREILMWITVVENNRDVNGDGWQEHWLAFATDLADGEEPPQESPDDHDQITGWIQDVVQGFCQIEGVIDKFRSNYEGEN